MQAFERIAIQGELRQFNLLFFRNGKYAWDDGMFLPSIWFKA